MVVNNLSETQKHLVPKAGSFKFKDVDLEDPLVWAAFSRADTDGIFQCESNVGKQWAKAFKPSSINELSDLISAIRPGVLECVSGNTKIHTNIGKHKDGRTYYQGKTAKDLYEQWIKFQDFKHKGNRKLTIISIDEENGTFFRNYINKAFYNGKKSVYNVYIRSRMIYSTDKLKRDFNFQCTEDHLLLTLSGWKPLKNLTSDDYIAVTNKRIGRVRKNIKLFHKEKGFRDLCFQNYIYKCIFCDWSEGSLDVNHLEGNRKTNNNIDNLCFMCPNHHRMFHEGKFDMDYVKKIRSQYELQHTKDIRYVKFEKMEYCGEEDVYDFEVEGPNHNYIAGDFIVHNCGMTDSYAKRKNKLEEATTGIHPVLDEILKDTHACLLYQEQSIKIAQELAGYSEIAADELRRALGKKLPEEVAKHKITFAEGAAKKGLVTKEQAEEIFSWIEKGQRYLFNASHAYSYAHIAYFCMYQKVHFPTEFYCSWLTYADDKPEPQEERAKLVNDAKLHGVSVLPPDIRRKNVHFEILEPKKVIYGLSHIRGIGEASVVNISKCSLKDFNQLILSVRKIKRSIAEALIKSGACDCYSMPRMQMLRIINCLFGRSKPKDQQEQEPAQVKALTEKELFIFYKHVHLGVIAALQKVIDEKACMANRVKIIESKIKWLETVVADNNRQNSIWESLYLGINLTCSAADDFDKVDKNVISCRRALQSEPDDYFGLHVVIDGIKLKVTGERSKTPGREYAYLSVSDNSCALSLVAWPECWEKIKVDISEGMVVYIKGRYTEWAGRSQWVINNLKVIG